MRLPSLPNTLPMRLTIALSILVLLAATLTNFVSTREAAVTQVQSQRQMGHDLTQTLIPVIRDMVENYDFAGLERSLKQISTNPAFPRLRITDVDGFILYENARTNDKPNWVTTLLLGGGLNLKLSSAITSGELPLGQMELALASTPLNNGIQNQLLFGGLVAAVLLLIGTAVAYAWVNRLVTPLKPLAAWAREFARGNWKPRIKLINSGSREIQLLNQALSEGADAMQHHIRSLEETRELLEHSENRLRKLVNGMHEILFELDPDGRITFLNPAWQSLTGFPIEESLGKPFSDFLLDDDAIRDFSHKYINRLDEKNRELSLRTASGKRIWASLEASSQTDSAGNFTGVIGTLGDITKSVELNWMLSRYQDELYNMSVTDPLTGLYNRRHFDTQLEVILSDHLSKKRSVCLLLIDLDGFKFINDTYGHPFGDEVLRTTAHLLQQKVRRNDYIARLAGDEFAMVLKNTDLSNATRIAQKLHGKINETRVPLPVGYLQLQSSMGVAEAPTHGRNAQDLVSAADVALYHSKQRGRNRIEVLSPDISKAMMSIFNQGFQLRNALEQGKLHPAFQPICNMQNGTPVAYEVLARMRLDDDVIQAKDFIGLAEELGLTRDVDLHIIRTALANTPIDQALFLNVDLTSFNDRHFAKELSKLLQPACDGGRSITIEITERENIPISDALHEDIRNLRALGCKLALDDFGSGYSTYSFLNQFRPDYLKIEGSFVRGMLLNESDRKIVTHIHELATSFGMETIAESVENENTQKALQQIGIRTAQGHYYGAPTL
jgi:diguanylate cyclase (GGDEF)-like protein/PAS domain S-box-containing protein